MKEETTQLPIAELHAFRNHPFRVTDDEIMRSTVESISQFGILTPVLVRPMESGGYEILSGHRRCHAAQKLGLDTVPALVRSMDDDEAVITMVDSNLQREHILPSERAKAYKMKQEAMQRKLGRPAKEKGGRDDHHLQGKKTRELIAEQTGESPRTVQRYLTLNNLIPEFMTWVDDGTIHIAYAEDLAQLSQENQRILLPHLKEKLLSVQQIRDLKRAGKSKKLTEEIITRVKHMMPLEKSLADDALLIEYDENHPPEVPPYTTEETLYELKDAIEDMMYRWRRSFKLYPDIVWAPDTAAEIRSIRANLDRELDALLNKTEVNE